MTTPDPLQIQKSQYLITVHTSWALLLEHTAQDPDLIQVAL